MQHGHISLKIANRVFPAYCVYSVCGDVVCCRFVGLSLRCIGNAVLTTDLPPPSCFTQVKYITSQSSIDGYSCPAVAPTRLLLVLWAVFVARESVGMALDMIGLVDPMARARSGVRAADKFRES